MGVWSAPAQHCFYDLARGAPMMKDKGVASNHTQHANTRHVIYAGWPRCWCFLLIDYVHSQRGQVQMLVETLVQRCNSTEKVAPHQHSGRLVIFHHCWPHNISVVSAVTNCCARTCTVWQLGTAAGVYCAWQRVLLKKGAVVVSCGKRRKKRQTQKHSM